MTTTLLAVLVLPVLCQTFQTAKIVIWKNISYSTSHTTGLNIGIFFSLFRKLYVFLSEIVYSISWENSEGKNFNFSIMCWACTTIWIFSFEYTWCQDCTCHSRKGIPSNSPQQVCKDTEKSHQYLTLLHAPLSWSRSFIPFSPWQKPWQICHEAPIKFQRCISFSYSEHELGRCKHGNSKYNVYWAVSGGSYVLLLKSWSKKMHIFVFCFPLVLV